MGLWPQEISLLTRILAVTSRMIVDSADCVQALVFSFVYFKTCLTIVKRMVYRPVARKFCWGVLLKEMWTFSYCSHSANHSPRTVDEEHV